MSRPTKQNTDKPEKKDNDGTGDFDDTQDLSALTAGTYNVIIKDL